MSLTSDSIKVNRKQNGPFLLHGALVPVWSILVLLVCSVGGIDNPEVDESGLGPHRSTGYTVSAGPGLGRGLRRATLAYMDGADQKITPVSRQVPLTSQRTSLRSDRSYV